jgi:hypothetical protein
LSTGAVPSFCPAGRTHRRAQERTDGTLPGNPSGET